MTENELWIALGEKLNEQGIYFIDMLGHISTLNSTEDAFDSEQDAEEAFNQSSIFAMKLEAIMKEIIK